MPSCNFRQRNIQKSRDTVRPAGACADLRGQEQHVTFAEGVLAAGVLELTAAREAYQGPRHSRFANYKQGVCNDPSHIEVITMNELLPQHWRGLFRGRRHRGYGTLLEVNAGYRLIHLQGPPFACPGIEMVPVVETKRDVAIVLDFKYHHVAQ